MEIKWKVISLGYISVKFSADFGGIDSFPLSWATGVACLGEVKGKSIKVMHMLFLTFVM